MDIMFTIKQDRMIWRAALLAFKILKNHGRLDHAGSVLVVWNAASEDLSLFPPTLMPEAESAVADRMNLISSREHLGRQLCPELD
jgi:hypothetical protein